MTTSKDLATTGSTTLAIADDGWSDSQLAALTQLGVEHASPADLDVYHHVCVRTGLDPFARQIYMIQREGKQTIQTGIDGFRLVARRAVNKSGEKFSIGAPEWCGPDGVWTEVWLSDQPPAAARVTIYRGEGTFVGIALWREYVGLKRDGNITRMWATRGAGQLSKCAEALGLRKAFPQDLSGLYTEDEFAGVERSNQAPREARNTLRDVLASDDTVVGEVIEDDAPPADESPMLNTRSKLARAMYAAINNAGISDAERLPWISSVIGRTVSTSAQMTDDDARKVLAALDQTGQEK